MLNQIAAIHGTGAPAVTNSYESIATVTVGGSSVSTISFSSIPSTFKHLQIRGISRNSNTNTNYQFMKINFNSDTASNYAYHLLRGDGSSAQASGGASSAFGWNGLSADGGNTSGIFSAFVIDVLDYQNTSKYKTVRSLAGFDKNGGGYIALQSSQWRSTSAVSSIQFTDNGSWNFVQNSTIALYGIKG